MGRDAREVTAMTDQDAPAPSGGKLPAPEPQRAQKAPKPPKPRKVEKRRRGRKG